MRLALATAALVVALREMRAPAAAAHELSGTVAVEGRWFVSDPHHSGQQKNNGSVALQPEYYHEWASGAGFTAVPFARIDSADPERTHFDVRELNVLWWGDAWELRVGVGKVFWGVTEFVHLVDIVNQTDLVESIDGEEKLGQPMAHLSVPRDWGVVDLFVLPYFRERTFPGRNGRLRSSLPVGSNEARFESHREARHVDFAARYSHSIGDWDLGLHHFYGTGREPTLLREIDADGEVAVIPLYEQINQTGLDLQWVAGRWLWKLETIHRHGQGEGFFASIGGFEYTLVRVADTGMDLGVIGEWAYDERGDEATTPFDNDAMFALRFVLNDAADTQILVGVSQDIGSPTRFGSLEASRRIGDRWRADLEIRFFSDVAEDDPLFDLRDDDFLCFQLTYHF